MIGQVQFHPAYERGEQGDNSHGGRKQAHQADQHPYPPAGAIAEEGTKDGNKGGNKGGGEKGVPRVKIEFDDLATDAVSILAANVGIGNANPAAKLEVDGSIYIPPGQGNIGIGTWMPSALMDVGGETRTRANPQAGLEVLR